MLKIFRKVDDTEVYRSHFGDLGVIVIAGIITLSGLMLLLLPSPFAKMEQDQAKAAKIQAQAAKVARQKAIDQAVASGEVGVDIQPAKH